MKLCFSDVIAKYNLFIFCYKIRSQLFTKKKNVAEIVEHLFPENCDVKLKWFISFHSCLFLNCSTNTCVQVSKQVFKLSQCFNLKFNIEVYDIRLSFGFVIKHIEIIKVIDFKYLLWKNFKLSVRESMKYK